MRIYVTIGSFKPFDRLMKAIDKSISKRHEYIIQTGDTNYTFKNTYANVYIYKYLNELEHISNIKRADVVITHVGIGTIIDLLKYKKKVIFYPRLFRFNEIATKQHEDMSYQLRKLGNTVVFRNQDLKLSKAKEIKFYNSDTEIFKSNLLHYIKKRKLGEKSKSKPLSSSSTSSN